MHARIQLYVWMAALVVLGLGFTAYKHWQLGFPLIPGEKQTVWTAEAKIQFQADGEPVKVGLNLPDDTENLVVIESGAASHGYGFQRLESEHEPRGVWSAREVRGAQTLYYQVEAYRGDGTPYVRSEEAPVTPVKPAFSEPEATAADSILEDVFLRSADAKTMAARLIELLNAKEPNETVRTLLRGVDELADRNQLLLDLMHSGGVPARLLRGIDLSEFYDGDAWVVIDPQSGKLGMSQTFLPWQRGDQWLLQVEGGRKSRVSFSVVADERAARNVAIYLGREQHAGLVDFSIFSLPVDVQNTFAMLLVVLVVLAIILGIGQYTGYRLNELRRFEPLTRSE